MSTATLSPPLSSVKVSRIVSQAEIIAAVCNGTITQEKAAALLASLSPAKQSGPLYCKIGEKGAVSVYGLNSPRFPVTLYAAQWERLADFIPSVLDFIKQWEGKEYTGQAGTNGNKHSYRVILARR
ncbi:MAG: hypothetical protein ABSA16_13450 [Thermoguttaceae bacterium]|jgi:hypothetical protein